MKQRSRQPDAAVADAGLEAEGKARALIAAAGGSHVEVAARCAGDDGPFAALSRPLADAEGYLEPSVPPCLRGQAGALHRAVETAVARASATGRVHYVSLRIAVADCDPLALFAGEPGPDRFFWQQPNGGFALAAVGCVKALDVDPRVRFTSASAAAQAMLGDVVTCGHAARSLPAPLLVGGFSFAAGHRAIGDWAAFPGACLFLPEILLVCRAGEACLTVNAPIAPGLALRTAWSAVLAGATAAHARVERLRGLAVIEGGTGALVRALVPAGGCEAPPSAQDQYRRRIEAALGAIAAGALEKVVLARSLRMLQPGGFDVPSIMHRLRTAYPDCVSLAVGRGADCFVAASPERLVSFDGERVETEALAGTAPRGVTAEDDGQLGRALLENPKERAEHAAVVRAIRAALADVCTALEGPVAPQLLRLAGIQHLYTPLRGRLRQVAGAVAPTILDLVGRLHPTPAVGGLPREAALAWICQGEELERGWYAGPVGYMDCRGGGEFRVALRSALLRNPPREGAPGVASLFAGAGVVAGSLPEREWHETSLKLRALLTPLTEL